MTREDLALLLAREFKPYIVTFSDLLEKYGEDDEYDYPRKPAMPSRGWVKRLVDVGKRLMEQGAEQHAETYRPTDDHKADVVSHETGGEATTEPVRRRQPAKPVLMRGAVWDLECTDFGTEGYAGYVICCCILPLDGSDVQTLSIRFDEHGDDRRLVREIAAALNEYDIWIGHNLSSFDCNYLNSRLMFHGFPTLPVGLVFDTFQVAKSLGIKTRKGLGNLMDYFGLEGTKTTIFRTSWNNVRSPYVNEFTGAMDEILYHCAEDVKGNKRLFDVLYPYALSMRQNPFKVSKMMGNGWAYMEDAA